MGAGWHGVVGVIDCSTPSLYVKVPRLNHCREAVQVGGVVRYLTTRPSRCVVIASRVKWMSRTLERPSGGPPGSAGMSLVRVAPSIFDRDTDTTWDCACGRPTKMI